MRLSIAICTHNRANTLAETLAHLLPQVADTEVELVVVANDVCDDTLDVCRAIGVTCVQEHQRGLGHARNTAISATRGEAILWLDDDVTVADGLIDAYLEALAAYPDDAFFGGPIIPEFEGTPPPWAFDALKVIPTIWAERDLGASDRPFDLLQNEYPFGANMLVRRRALATTFRTDLGRDGRRVLIGGEESALFLGLIENGETGRWVARAAVRHRIDSKRQTLGYVRRYFIGQGVQRVILKNASQGDANRPMLKDALTLLIAWLSYLRHRVYGSPAEWLRPYAAFYLHVGTQFSWYFRRARRRSLKRD